MPRPLGVEPIRAIADSRELICEFDLRGTTYRLILPQGKIQFSVDVLVPDEYRFWIRRWEPYALGTYQGLSVVRHRSVNTGRPLSAAMLGALDAALNFVHGGPTTGTRFHS